MATSTLTSTTQLNTLPQEQTQQDATKPQSSPAVQMPTPANVGFPKFDNKEKEREYLKKRLALAFRIFAKYGFDEGVAGHITLRVSKGNNSRPPRTNVDDRIQCTLIVSGSIHSAFHGQS